MENIDMFFENMCFIYILERKTAELWNIYEKYT